MKKRLIIFFIFIIVVVLIIIGFFIFNQSNSEDVDWRKIDYKNMDAEKFINIVYKQFHQCIKKCPEDANGYVDEVCFKECNSVAENGVMVSSSLIKDPEKLKGEEGFFTYIQSAISQENKRNQECFENCGDPDLNIDYECFHKCF